MKQQYIITLTIYNIEISTLLDSWSVTHHLSKFCAHKKCLS